MTHGKQQGTVRVQGETVRMRPIGQAPRLILIDVKVVCRVPHPRWLQVLVQIDDRIDSYALELRVVRRVIVNPRVIRENGDVTRRELDDVVMELCSDPRKSTSREPLLQLSTGDLANDLTLE